MINSFDLPSFAVSFILSGFATYYVATMVAEGKGILNIFGYWRAFVYNKVQIPFLNSLSESEKRYDPKHWLWDGVTCPRCMSWVIAILPTIPLAIYFWLDLYQMILVLLALAGLSRWLYSFEG